jgi:hypothetical protein
LLIEQAARQQPEQRLKSNHIRKPLKLNNLKAGCGATRHLIGDEMSPLWEWLPNTILSRQNSAPAGEKGQLHWKPQGIRTGMASKDCVTTSSTITLLFLKIILRHSVFR